MKERSRIPQKIIEHPSDPAKHRNSASERTRNMGGGVTDTKQKHQTKSNQKTNNRKKAARIESEKMVCDAANHPSPENENTPKDKNCKTKRTDPM